MATARILFSLSLLILTTGCPPGAGQAVDVQAILDEIGQDRVLILDIPEFPVPDELGDSDDEQLQDQASLMAFMGQAGYHYSRLRPPTAAEEEGPDVGLERQGVDVEDDCVQESKESDPFGVSTIYEFSCFDGTLDIRWEFLSTPLHWADQVYWDGEWEDISFDDHLIQSSLVLKDLSYGEFRAFHDFFRPGSHMWGLWNWQVEEGAIVTDGFGGSTQLVERTYGVMLHNWSEVFETDRQSLGMYAQISNTGSTIFETWAPMADAPLTYKWIVTTFTAEGECNKVIYSPEGTVIDAVEC